MNTYYSNLIEGHDTRPRDIERALAGQFDEDHERRNLQLEAAAHVRVQEQVDELAARARLPEPASQEFVLWLHREFYREAPDDMLTITSGNRVVKMVPGEWRSRAEHEVGVGRHVPPSSDRVAAFMTTFAERYRLEPCRSSSVQLHPSLPRWQRPRLTADDARHGPARRDWCSWVVVRFSRSSSRHRKPRRIQEHDGSRGFASTRRPRRPWELVDTSLGGLHVVVPPGLSRSGSFHVDDFRDRFAGEASQGLCRAKRREASSGGFAASRTSGRAGRSRAR